MKSFGIGWCIAALLTLTALAQTPRRGFWAPSARFVLVGVEMQTPTFKSAVDLVPVDVSIVDKTGRPVRGLEVSDFVLSIDGRPRKVESAQFISSASADPPPHAVVLQLEHVGWRRPIDHARCRSRKYRHRPRQGCRRWSAPVHLEPWTRRSRRRRRYSRSRAAHRLHLEPCGDGGDAAETVRYGKRP